ncbi:hypothetical protein OK074_3749 [Actinobacteria bacterium OK074]|nr:hypothetical protein OK074_3749 [Actinobacteria bacterium OK074]
MRDRGQAGWRAAVVCGAVLAAVAACSLQDGDDGPDRGAQATPTRRATPEDTAALRAVQKATEAAGSARIDSATVMGGTLSLTTTGTLGWSGDPVGLLRITYTGGELATTMRALSSTSMEARLLPDAYYAKVGAKFAASIQGKHWIRYDYDDLSALPDGSGVYLTESFRNTAPVQPVELLLAAGTVRRVGRERVRGESTTHYTGTVDPVALTGPDAADLKKQLQQAQLASETVDLWVNKRNLLVKKVEQGTLASGRMSATTYYDDYGVKVSVTKPAADDTADFQHLLDEETS